MKKKIIAFVITLILLLSSFVTAYAGPGDGGGITPPPGPPRGRSIPVSVTFIEFNNL